MTLITSGCSFSDLDSPSIGEHDSEVIVNEKAYSSRMVRIKVTENKAVELESGKALPIEGIVKVKRTFPYAGKFEKRTREEGMHLWYDVTIDENAMNLTKASYSLKKIEGIQKVELRPKTVRLQESNFFNDPYLHAQWHYKNDGIYDGFEKGCDINVEKVWKEFTTGDPSVIVAVVDAGVEATHPDLKANMWVNEAELNGQPGIDDDNNGYIDDINGYNFVKDKGEIVPHDHATHVAGTIGAVNNNGIGVCGIAGGDYKAGKKGVRMMTCEIVEIDATEEANIAAAIKYGADNGAVISQNSWSYLEGVEEIKESDRLAIDYFVKYAGQDENGNQVGPMNGGIVIFAAGNENRTYSYPAIYENVVAVSALNAAYEKTSYSNYGDWVDIAAPGGVVHIRQSIFSTVTVMGGSYGEKEGTSMACPHVSGVAALLVSYYGQEKGFNPNKLKNLLYSSAVNINDYNTYYKNQLGRLVNAYGAFTFTSDAGPKPVKDPEISALSNNIICKWAVPYDPDERQAFSFGVYVSKEDFGGDITRPGVEFHELEAGNYKKGDMFEGMIQGLDFNTDYYVAVDASDMFNNRSAVSEMMKVTTLDNHAPEIRNSSVNVELATNQTRSVMIYYSEPDFHKVTSRLESENPAIRINQFRDDSVEVVINALLSECGTHKSVLVLSDPYGMSAKADITYTVQANNKPEAIKPIENLSMELKSEPAVIDLNDYFTDKDGEQLTYRCSADTDIVELKLNGSMLTISPKMSGDTNVTVTATDGRNETAEITFRVNIGGNVADMFSCYPNPVIDNLYIKSASTASVSVRLTSALGQVICDQIFNLEAGIPVSIDLSDRESGTYVLTMTINEEVITKTIMKL